MTAVSALTRQEGNNWQALSDFKYQRVDMTKLAAHFSNLAQELAKANSASDKYLLLRKCDELYRAYYENVSYLIFQAEVKADNNSYYQTELAYYEASMSLLQHAYLGAKVSILRGDLGELAKLTGKRYLLDLQMQYFLKQDATLKINAKQSEIVKRIRHELLCLPMQFGKLSVKELADLNRSFNELLALGTRKAKLLGYNNYGELAISLAARSELGAERLREIRQAVQKYLVPLYKGLLVKAGLYQNGWLSFQNQASMFKAFQQLITATFSEPDLASFGELKEQGCVKLAVNSIDSEGTPYKTRATKLSLNGLYLANWRQTLVCLHSFAHITDWVELYQGLVSTSFTLVNKTDSSLIENELPDTVFKSYASQVLESLCFPTSEKLFGRSYFYKRVMQILEKLLHICLLTELQEQLYLVNPQASNDLLTLSRNLYSSLHEIYFPGLKRYSEFILPCNFNELLAESFDQQLKVLLELSGLMLWDEADKFKTSDERLEAFYNLLKLGSKYTPVEAIEHLDWPSAFDEDAIKRLAYKLAYHLEVNNKED